MKKTICILLAAALVVGGGIVLFLRWQGANAADTMDEAQTQQLVACMDATADRINAMLDTVQNIRDDPAQLQARYGTRQAFLDTAADTLREIQKGLEQQTVYGAVLESPETTADDLPTDCFTQLGLWLGLDWTQEADDSQALGDLVEKLCEFLDRLQQAVRRAAIEAETASGRNGVMLRQIAADRPFYDQLTEAVAAERQLQQDAVWLGTPQPDPVEAVCSVLEEEETKDSVTAVTIQAVELDEELTQRNLEALSGSDLAREAGFTDDYLADNFAAVTALYDVTYNDAVAHRGTSGTYRCNFLLIRDEATGLWSVWNYITPWKA